MCAEFDIVEPKFNDLDTLDSLLQKDFFQIKTLKTYSGTKCKDGPFIEVNVRVSVRGGSMSLIANDVDLTSNCYPSVLFNTIIHSEGGS